MNKRKCKYEENMFNRIEERNKKSQKNMPRSDLMELLSVDGWINSGSYSGSALTL